MSEQKIPSVDYALICGSANWGLRFPEDIQEPGISVIQGDMEFQTPWGKTSEWKLLEFDASITVDGKPRRALCVFSHGWPLDEIDHSAQRRVFWVLREAGVKKVVASSTVGSLNRAILERDFVIASDILELTQTQYSLLPGRVRYDCSGKQLVCPACAAIVERTARRLWPVENRVYGTSAGLVAAHAWGPRLTTPAEVTAYRTMGGDFINHSLAPEATLAREIGACFVNCAFVTAAYPSYFSPPQVNVLGEGVQVSLAPIASRIALQSVANFPIGETQCVCSQLRSEQDASHYNNR
jgi:5'-methylthioadenosine phosphorylase